MTPGSHILIHYLTRKWHEYSDEAIQSAEGPSQQYHAILHILGREIVKRVIRQIFNEDDDEGDQLEGNQVERKQNFLSLVDSVSEAIADVALSRSLPKEAPPMLTSISVPIDLTNDSHIIRHRCRLHVQCIRTIALLQNL
ncbi:gtpase activating rab protein [Moniliophthora roreri]|nr:gtpase activating rab protein [Moniliophthora roreri]